MPPVFLLIYTVAEPDETGCKNSEDETTNPRNHSKQRIIRDSPGGIILNYDHPVIGYEKQKTPSDRKNRNC